MAGEANSWAVGNTGINMAAPSTRTSSPSPAPQNDFSGGVQWVGADGNRYIKNSTGTTNLGPATFGGQDYWGRQGYGVIDDPRVLGTTTTKADGTTGTTGYAAPAKVLDTAQLQSLDSLIGSLGTIKDQSIGKAAIKRDTSKREKQDEKKREEDKYNGKKLTTLQDFSGAKTDTDLNTRDTLENLISSLSTLGLGGSRALTRQILEAANKSNRKANATQATNNQGLDSAFNEYTVGNENDIKKIDDQYGYDEGEANKAYYQGKQNALYKKADVYGAVDDAGSRNAIMGEANGLNGMIAGSAFMNPQYNGETRKMATPDLASYTQDIAKYDTTGITGAGADPLTPVASDGMNTPGNLAVRAIAVNDKDLGIKKKTEDALGYGV